MEKKNCKNLDVSKDLMKFVKVLMRKSLKNFIIFFFIKKKKKGLLEILTRFNGKF
jgi:hypothetical protein